MKVPKSESLENTLANINSYLDQSVRGSQFFSINSGDINMLNLKINDINKEQEYQERKNFNTSKYYKHTIFVHMVTTFAFFIFQIVTT